MSNIAEYSKIYCDFYLFPVFGKIPPKKFLWRDLSSRCPNQWVEWEEEYLNCDWAVDCSKTGLIVWDVDLHKSDAKKSWEFIVGKNWNHGTLKAISKNGGEHFYFKGKPITDKIGILPGIDIKSDGGYVVLPPSKGYEWVKEEATIKNHPEVLSNFYSKKSIKKKEKFQVPEVIVKGKRDTMIFKEACSLLGMGHTEDFVLEVLHKTNKEKCTPPLSESHIIRKLISAQDQVKKNEDKEEKKEKNESNAKRKEYAYFKKNLFEASYKERRFCPIKQNLFVLENEKGWKTASSKEKILRSKALDIQLPPAPVGDHLDRWISTEEQHGKEEKLLIDIPKWDGKDRIAKFLGCLQITNMSMEFSYQLLKHYLANIWRRIESPKERNWVLVLHGGQNLGKDWWIREFLGGWDTRYYFVRLNAFTDEIRTYMHLDGHVIIHMAEFDEAKKWSPGFLKDLITKESLDYIGKYQKEITSIPSRHTLIASANRLDFLTDVSGSSRFLIFDISKIIYEYPMNESMQVIAQSRDLFEKGYMASKDALEWLDREQERVTPPDTDLLIIEEFRDSLGLILGDRAQNIGCTVETLDSMAKKVLHSDLENVWKILCEKHGKRRKTVIGIVKPIFGRKSGSVRYFTLETH